MNRARATAMAVAVSAALTAGGCGSTVPQRESGPAREPSAAQSRLLERAEQILISECMAGRGFVYAVTEPVREGEAQRTFPYGVDDVDWARAHGYGGRDERAAAEARRADPNQRYFARLPAPRRAAARTALMGASPVGLTATTPTGMTLTAGSEGCMADAQRALYGDLPGWFRVKVVTMNLRPVREARVREDARWTEAVGQWSACMRAAGRPYATPADSRRAAVEATAGVPPERADETETALAVTEATCATGTSLARVSRTLDRAHGEEVRAQHQAEIDLRRRFQNDALPKAERVVARHTHREGDSHA
ncbi:hypothetical protein ACIRO3_19765 [Streptomyces sp. NPDC102278]|uniref:hypothetical protein n=1 Tax=Streptomyces sp. NPDC102278 TaxID=3366152 RepID=UPI0038290168